MLGLRPWYHGTIYKYLRRVIDTLSSTIGNLNERALFKQGWQRVEREGVVLHCSPLLAQYEDVLVHAFTTRIGGQSQPPLDNFNLGRHIDDEAARLDAMQNREKLCSVLGADHLRLVVPGQVHSSTVIFVDKPLERSVLQKVDGVTTNEKRLPLLLHFADCVPVILFDPTVKAIAVIHAGWRGTAGQIVKVGAAKMQEVFHSHPRNIKAAIGPAIGSCCYPTSEDVADQLSATVFSAEGLISRNGIDDPPRPDLKAINAMQLLEFGVGEVDVTDVCTACRPELFYSHRQSGGKTGRQGAIAEIVA
jgi:polyphenol oxidase